MEKTLVLIKPDAVSSKQVGKIISVYEENQLTIESIKILIPDDDILSRHYQEHINKDFYPDLIEFMKSGRIIAMVLSSEDAIEKVRRINGKTNPVDAEMGSIRKTFGTNVTMNAVHGSANPIDARREIEIWFN
ncbi:MAG: Nucleoside diphosphate kinase [Clostridiales bacterium 38_11]|nr:MAG: Nucleoside diphosphate kinase [Clostridiales bacterium 38_11]HBH13055.1 nucleoside-diphosphate kinase [Clostridiales bacterium]